MAFGPMNAAILGTGMTRFGRWPGEDLRSLSEAAVAEALADAGLRPREVQMVLFGNAVEGVLHGQEMIRAEVALRRTGLHGVPMINVENACASSSSAFQLACMAVSSGAAEVVLVVGAEQLTHRDKQRTFAALATAVDLYEHVSLAAQVSAAGATEGVSHSPLMDLYAAKSRAFMDDSGSTVEDLARVSVKNRLHGSLNPLAQFRRTVDLDTVLGSRLISDPLRLLMCAPIGDGAAAVAVTSADYARRSERPYVLVNGIGLTSNGADSHAAQPVARAARAAFDQAGLEPDDIDVAEVHDACSAAELWLYEEVGFAKPGDAAQLIRSGATQLGGGIPVNVSGGLLARGHPLGATGCAQLVELANQLRGRCGGRQVAGARTALAQNSGGILDDGDEAAAAVTILSRATA
ncbi:MAG TPA: thiolase family protein [Streptosporangiaceae bacterium]